jgi:hypothetical protein
MSENVILHSPDPLRDQPDPEPPGGDALETGVPGRLDSPWLRWMLRAQAPLDVVHFVCPGYLSSSYGALDFGAAPLEELEQSSSRLVTAGQLIAFLTRAGTWGVGITIPSRMAWPAGLRILAHRIAQLRPGPVIVHAPHYAPRSHGRKLRSAYRAAFTEENESPPATPAISLYIHPERALSAPPSPGVVFDQPLQAHVGKLTLKGTASEERLVAGDAPAWLAANQRTLERWAAESLDALTPEAKPRPIDRGVADALTFVSEVLGGLESRGRR